METDYQSAVLNELKRKELGGNPDDEAGKRKRKRKKGPNPLSCLKRKKKKPNPIIFYEWRSSEHS